MRRATLALVVSLALAGADASVPQEFTLPNGLRVRLEESHDSPVLAARLVVRSQGAEDPAGKPGLSAWLAALLPACGAGPYSTHAALVQAQEGIGLHVRFSHRRGQWTWDIFSESRLQDQALEHLAHAVFRPLWDSALAEQQRKILVEERNAKGSLGLAEACFQGLLGLEAETPPSAESLMSLDAKDLDGFRIQVLRPDHALLALQGDISLSQAKQLANLHFGTWGKPGDMKSSSQASGTSPHSVVMVAPGKALHLWMGAALPTDSAEAVGIAKRMPFLLQGLGETKVPKPLTALRWEWENAAGRSALYLKAAAPAGTPIQHVLELVNKEWANLRNVLTSETIFLRANKLQAGWNAATTLHPETRMDMLCEENRQAPVDLSLVSFQRLMGSWMDATALRCMVLGGDAVTKTLLEKQGLAPVECQNAPMKDGESF